MQVNVDEVIYTLAARSGGVVRRSDLVGAGIGRGALARRVERGALRVAGRGVYVVPSMRTEATDLRLAVALVRGSAVSHMSAAGVHRMVGVGRPTAEVHLVGPLGARRSVVGGVVLHRTKHLPAVDVVEAEGLRVTSIERTLCDLASQFRHQRLRHVIEESIVADRCDPGALLACRSAYVRRGRVGSALLNIVLDELFEDEPMVASELERRMTRLMSNFSIVGFVAQYQPEWFDGRRGLVDFAHVAARVIIEVDGRRWHAVTQAFVEDRRRDRRAQSHGWLVLRFGWHEVVHRPGAVASEIAAVIAARLA